MTTEQTNRRGVWSVFCWYEGLYCNQSYNYKPDIYTNGTCTKVYLKVLGTIGVW